MLLPNVLHHDASCFDVVLLIGRRAEEISGAPKTDGGKTAGNIYGR